MNLVSLQSVRVDELTFLVCGIVPLGTYVAFNLLACAMFSLTTLMLLVTPLLRVGADLVIGTVVDVNMMQTERQDFEEGWGEWSESNMELMDTSAVSDAKVILLIGVGNG